MARKSVFPSANLEFQRHLLGRVPLDRLLDFHDHLQSVNPVERLHLRIPEMLSQSSAEETSGGVANLGCKGVQDCQAAEGETGVIQVRTFFAAGEASISVLSRQDEGAVTGAGIAGELASSGVNGVILTAT